MESDQLQQKVHVSFLMIGCQRSGTTWTDAALRTHPEIFLPEKKQSYFFDKNYSNGFDWYLERFQAAQPKHKAIGEVATGYCLLDAIPLMAKHLPDCKLMMVMRNPIDRAYSNYQSRQVEEGWSNFEEALESEPDLLERGHYIDQIECLMEHYIRENVLFLLYDDLSDSDTSYIHSVYSFLGVNCSVATKMIGQRKNAAMFPTLRKWLHQCGLKSIVTLLSKSRVGDTVRRSRKSKGRAYQPMNQKTKERLVNHFAPYNKRLSLFLNRDLSAWNEQ